MSAEILDERDKCSKIREVPPGASILSLKDKAKSFVEDREGGKENQRSDKSGNSLGLFLLAHPPFTLLFLRELPFPTHSLWSRDGTDAPFPSPST